MTVLISLNNCYYYRSCASVQYSSIDMLRILVQVTSRWSKEFVSAVCNFNGIAFLKFFFKIWSFNTFFFYTFRANIFTRSRCMLDNSVSKTRVFKFKVFRCKYLSYNNLLNGNSTGKKREKKNVFTRLFENNFYGEDKQFFCFFFRIFQVIEFLIL